MGLRAKILWIFINMSCESVLGREKLMAASIFQHLNDLYGTFGPSPEVEQAICSIIHKVTQIECDY